MPINPDLMPLYPGGSTKSPEWLAIRQEMLDRAGWCCEFCLVEHCRRIWRLDGEDAYVTNAGSVHCDRTGKFLRLSDYSMEPARPVRIYLSVCHKDHDPANNGPDNLLVLCQQCHNRHDNPHRRETQHSKNATGDLFKQEGADHARC